MSLPRLSISLRLSLAVLLNSLLIGTTVAAATLFLLNRAAEREAYASIDRNMRVAWAQLRAHGEDFHMDGDRLMDGGVVLNGNFAIVDSVVQQVGGTSTIFAGDTRVATNVKKDDGSRAVGTKLAKNAAWDAVFGKGAPFRGFVDILGRPYITGYDPIKAADGKVVGVLYVGIPTENFFATVREVEWTFLAALSLCGAVGLAASLAVARRSVVAPLHRLNDAMGEIAEGRLDAEIPYLGRRDDIGDTARRLEVFRRLSLENREFHDEQARRAAEERERRRAELAAVADEMERGILALFDTVEATVEEMHVSSDSLKAVADASGDRSAAVAAAASQASAGARAMTETGAGLAASFTDMADRAGRTAAAVRALGALAQSTTERYRRLHESASRICSAVKLIDDVASQTNLLALNATIEAARAGEAGKGFAVVAGEVKALANQTAKATSDISAMTADVQSEAKEGEAAIAELVGAIAQAGALTDGITGAMGALLGASEAISGEASGLSAANSLVASSIADVARNAARTKERADALYTTASSLREEAKSIAAEISSFIARMRRG
jgi:methyl-accepting chemotaxis protein